MIIFSQGQECLTISSRCVISLNKTFFNFIHQRRKNMPEVSINYLAVLVCGIVHMVLGALWYSQLFFGKLWMKALGKSEDEIKEMRKGVWKAYLFSFMGALVMAFVLAHIIDYAQTDSIAGGLQGGFWVWLGFVITTSMAGILFEGRPKGLYFIYNGYQLVSLLIMGMILAIWA